MEMAICDRDIVSSKDSYRQLYLNLSKNEWLNMLLNTNSRRAEPIRLLHKKNITNKKTIFIILQVTCVV